MSGIGEKIIMARKARGMTQEELGRKAGLSQSFISDIEKEYRTPTDQNVILIAEALGDESLVIDSCKRCALRSHSIQKHFPEIDLRRRSRISVMTNRIKLLVDDIDRQAVLVESLHASTALYRANYIILYDMERDLLIMADILKIVTEKLAGIDIADSGI